MLADITSREIADACYQPLRKRHEHVEVSLRERAQQLMIERNDKDALFIMEQMTENFGEVGTCVHLMHELAMLPRFTNANQSGG